VERHCPERVDGPRQRRAAPPAVRRRLVDVDVPSLSSRVVAAERVEAPAERDENRRLSQTFEEAVERWQAPASDAEKTVSAGPCEPALVFADPGDLAHVVDNLVENALRYTPPGGSVRVRLSTTRDEARIEVSDTGVGIPEKDLPFVFERFFRSDRARRAYTGGSGLGLSIVRWIVEAHKGKVEIASEVDRGTTVKVKLPLVT